MRKRVLSLLLAICLVVGLLPPTALAAAATPADITVSIAGIEQVAAVGSVYYLNYTDATSTWAAEAPASWNVKLDNSTGGAAELTLKSLTVTNIEDAVKATGSGELKIIADGESTISAPLACVNTTMTGGTTYTSTNGGVLKLTKTGTGGGYPVIEFGGPLTIDGGKLDINIAAGKASGLYAYATGCGITIKNYAVVNIKSTSTTANSTYRVLESKATVTIDNSTLRFSDVGGSGIQFSNWPVTITGDVTKSHGDNADGTGAQTVDSFARYTAYAYVGIVYNCAEHEYSNASDADCNKCGEIREVSKELTLTVSGTAKTVPAGSVYYGKVTNTTISGNNNDTAVLTDSDDSDWNIKVDNTVLPAVLTLKGTIGTRDVTNQMLNVTGDGALKVVADGDVSILSKGSTNVSSSIWGTVLFNMAGGTTITSASTGGTLAVTQSNTGGYPAVNNVAGNLTFENIAATISINRSNANAFAAVMSAGDVTFTGGSLAITTTRDDRGTMVGISATGALTLQEGANVSISNTGTLGSSYTAAKTAVTASSIVINKASLSISNPNRVMLNALSVMPTITSATAVYQNETTDVPQTLTDEHLDAKFITITATCGDDHTYTDGTDAECNICGFIRDIPTPVTLEIYTTVSASEYDRLYWEVQPGKVYYAVTSGGRITQDLGALTEAPAEWNIKLDNSKIPAELVFNGADIQVNHTSGKPDGKYVDALTVTGSGALKVITQMDSHILFNYSDGFVSNMAGGVTFTSVDNSKLTISSLKTGYWENIQIKAGNLAFENANMYFSSKAVRGDTDDVPFVIAAENADVTIKGGEMVIDCLNQGVMALEANNLAVSDGAKITANGSGGYNGSNGSTNIPGANRTVGAIKVTNAFTVDASTVKVVNGFTGINAKAWAYAFNKMPAMTTATAVYSENTNGSNQQALNPADPAAPVNYPFVMVTIDCGGHHTWDNDGDAECNVCGFIREVPRDITVIFGSQVSTDTVGQTFTWNAAANEIYYAKTDAAGVITDLGKLAEAPAEWNIKLDNTKPVAELTLKGATIKKLTEKGVSQTNDAINIAGDGALKIIIDGENTIESGYNDVIDTSMAGGTTFTSVGDSKLSVLQHGTSGVYGIYEKVGNLNFENANIYAVSNRYNKWNYAIIGATAGNMNVSGGKMELFAEDRNQYYAYGVSGINVAGTLTLSNYAVVTFKHKSALDIPDNLTIGDDRFGVKAADIVINDASLIIQDCAENLLTYSISEMPVLNANVKAQYSESTDGSNLQALNPADPAAAIEYAYVSFVYDCITVDGDHTYSNAGDPYCDKCGFEREVSRDVTIRVTTGKFNTETAKDITKVIAPGEIYYAVADENGFITSFEKTTTAPEGWDFMVDNTGTTAKLIFSNGAYLYHNGDWIERTDTTTYLAVLSVTGAGKLQVINQGDASINSAYSNALETNMAGGTTYTSENGGTLSVLQSGTSGLNAIAEQSGTLTFENANIYAVSMRTGKYAYPVISAAGNMNVIGGKMEVLAKDMNVSFPSGAVNGINVTGKLTINEFAIVTVAHAGVAADNYAAKGGTALRYGVNAGEIVVDGASLYIKDNTQGMFEYSINKMPTVTGGTAAKYSESVDGTNLQVLNPADPAANVEYPYVSFAYDCIAVSGAHDYDSNYDPECNKCGEIRTVTRPITVTFGNFIKDVINQEVLWNAAPGTIYYASTSDDGVITDLGTADPGDGNWNIKLDNTKPVAELTFKNATIKKNGATVGTIAQTHNVIKAEGEGALKIIVDGDSTLDSGYNNVIDTSMAGGTTFTSVNGSKLSLLQSGTSGVNAITEKVGTLTFENARIYAVSKRTGMYANPIINAAGDLNVIGGRLELCAVDMSSYPAGAVNGMQAGGTLTLSDYATVSIEHAGSVEDTYKKMNAERRNDLNPPARYGVKAADIIINNANLYIKDNAQNMFEQSISKMPTISGNVKAQYSESLKGTDLQVLNPADATAPVDYPYVAIAYDCGGTHVYDDNYDPDCNKCGQTRAVPYDIDILFQFGSTEIKHVLWEAKVGEVYYAMTTEDGMVTDMGKRDTAPAMWNIKLDNTGAEAVLTLKGANITRQVRATSDVKYLDMSYGSLGIITAKGEGALKVVIEKDSTLTLSEAFNSIYTAMNGGTTYASVDKAKLTLTSTKSCITSGIVENIGSLTFDNAYVSVDTKYNHSRISVPTISTPRDMTVIGGKVEAIATGYATNGVVVGGNLTVKENGILLVHAKSGTGETTAVTQGLKVGGDITVDNATLMVKATSKQWSYMLNKMPIMVNASSYMSEKSTKDSKLEAFTMETGADMTEKKGVYFYFSNSEPGTLVDEDEDDSDSDFDFGDDDNPFTGDTVALPLVFALTLTCAAALVVLFSKKRNYRK